MSYSFFGNVRANLSSDVLVAMATMRLNECFYTLETLVYSILATCDGLIAVAASVQNYERSVPSKPEHRAFFGRFWVTHGCAADQVRRVCQGSALAVAATRVQLLRLYTSNRQAGWTRQKVFHCLIFASNFGYTLYFVLSPLAACGDWPCWPHACGFILVAIPQTIFLATFLLLLSFWVDLCHQATDEEEEEEDDEVDDDGTYATLPSSPAGRLSNAEKPPRRCCLCFRRLRVRGRQKTVIVAVLLICALTLAFAVLIWYGVGNNPIDSGTMVEVYSYFYAVIILLSGGGLAAYGLVLYTKMCRLRSGKASDDITKVAGLAVVSVVCFSLRASLIFFSDIPEINIWHARQEKREIAATLTLFYYFIGESIPSVVVLWVMREIPRRTSFNSRKYQGNGVIVRTASETEAEQALLLQQAILEQWIIPEPGVPSRLSLSRSYKSNASTPTTPPEVGRNCPGY